LLMPGASNRHAFLTGRRHTQECMSECAQLEDFDEQLYKVGAQRMLAADAWKTDC
jgi:hypothetical protein